MLSKRVLLYFVIVVHKKTIIIFLSTILLLTVSAGIYIYLIEDITFTPLPFMLPAFTSTKLGISGDPIDIVIIGSEDTIKQDFQKAAWLVPDKTTKATTEKIIKASIKNASYPTAPVSNLYLYKRKEDLAFELPTQTVRKRHHVRLWKTTYAISGKPVWIGADTYDSRIELSPLGLFPTHHVDADVDKERDFLTSTLSSAHVLLSVTQQRLTLPILLRFNGNGDWYHDSGIINVITLK